MTKRILDGFVKGLFLLGLSGAFVIGICFYLEVIFGAETTAVARIVFILIALYWLIRGFYEGGGKTGEEKSN